MCPYLDDLLDHIRTFLSIIIIWLSTPRESHIALKGFIGFYKNCSKPVMLFLHQWYDWLHVINL